MRGRVAHGDDYITCGYQRSEVVNIVFGIKAFCLNNLDTRSVFAAPSFCKGVAVLQIDEIYALHFKQGLQLVQVDTFNCAGFSIGTRPR